MRAIVYQAQAISLFENRMELWFAEFYFKQPVGTIAEIEGWKYYAQQKEDINEAVK